MAWHTPLPPFPRKKSYIFPPSLPLFFPFKKQTEPNSNESETIREVRVRRASLRPVAPPPEKDIKEVLGDDAKKIDVVAGGEDTPLKKEVRERRASLRPTEAPKEKVCVLGKKGKGWGKKKEIRNTILLEIGSIYPLSRVFHIQDIKEVLGAEASSIDIVTAPNESPMKAEIRVRRASLKPTPAPAEKDVVAALGDEKNNIGTITPGSGGGEETGVKKEIRERRASLRSTTGPAEKSLQERCVGGKRGKSCEFNE